MITLDFKLNNEYLIDLKWHDVKTADRVTIDFMLYASYITFRINEENYDDLTGSVPVLGFVMELYDIITDLKESGIGVLEFTESARWISFNRETDNAIISSNYASGPATVKFDELREAVATFLEKVMVSLLSITPELKDNCIFQEYANKLGLDFNDL